MDANIHFIPQTTSRYGASDELEPGFVIDHISPFELRVESTVEKYRRVTVRWHSERSAWIEVAEVG